MNVSIAAAFALVALGFSAAAKADGGATNPSTGSGPVVIGPGSSSTTSAYPGPWYWPDLHSQNRAIAFGSLILAASGSVVDDWKEVRAYNYCKGEAAGSIVLHQQLGHTGDDGQTSSDPDPAPLPSDACGWSLMVTTAYQFMVCPDGRAHIARSGDGVALKNTKEGDTFGWAEAIACGPGPFLTGADGGDDPNRPLDLARLTITLKH